MEMIKTTGFAELSATEMVQKHRESGVTFSEESKKAAISYTLGYLSLATCWCAPVSFAFGFAGTLYSCT